MSKETRGAAEERPSYKNTLNLLQTSFGMRANAVTREPELQSFWADHGIDFKLGLTNKGPPRRAALRQWRLAHGPCAQQGAQRHGE